MGMKNTNILVVEDDKETRKSLSKILGEKGYTIETAATGQEGITKAEKRFFNLVLLDIKLPDKGKKEDLRAMVSSIREYGRY